MSQAPVPAQVAPATLQDVRGALRRRMPVVLGAVLVGALLGAVVVAAAPSPVPSATVGVELRATGIDASLAQGRTAAALDVERRTLSMTSDAVLERAIEDHGAPLPLLELRRRTSTRQVGDLPLVRITVTNPQADVAVAAADAIARASLDVAREEATQLRDAQDRLFREQLDELYAEIGSLGSAIGEAEEAARIARIVADAEATAAANGEEVDPVVAELGPVDPDAAARAAALQGQRDAALRRASELERSRAALITHNVDPGTIVEAAAANAAARGLGLRVAAPATALLGLLVGCVLALVLDRLDSRLWTVEDVAAAAGTDRVLHVPREDLIGDGLRTGGGHRRLRTLTAPRDTATTVLLTSHDPDIGAGIAAGLASAIAGAGRPVVLIDVADRDAFGLPSGDVDGWLRGNVGIAKAARSPDGVPGLRVLRGSASSELASSATLAQLLAAPSEVVLVHVPGGADAGDALALAGMVDHVVIAVSARRDRADDVARTTRWLSRESRHQPVLVLAG